MSVSLIDLLSISPETAGIVSAVALVFVVVLDVYASVDDTPGNTPRQLVVRWTKWTSTVVGIRVTGAPIPFAFGVLLGHWFHPGSLPNLAGGFLGLGIVASVAASLSLLAGRLAVQPEGPRKAGWPAGRWSGPLSLLGILVGAVLWPVGG